MIKQAPASYLRTFINLAEMKVMETDGHLTIFRFTRSWKIMSGTPDNLSYELMDSLPAYESLDEALSKFIIQSKERP